MQRQVVNQKWSVFNNSDLCAPGVIVFFDDSDEPVMLGDINTAGGICDDCTNHGQVVREVLDLRNFIEQHVVQSRDPSTVPQDEANVGGASSEDQIRSAFLAGLECGESGDIACYKSGNHAADDYLRATVGRHP